MPMRVDALETRVAPIMMMDSRLSAMYICWSYDSLLWVLFLFRFLLLLLYLGCYMYKLYCELGRSSMACLELKELFGYWLYYISLLTFYEL